MIIQKKIHTFLSRIVTEDKMNVVDNTEETIEFILKKLETLNELEGILIEQIQQYELRECFSHSFQSMGIEADILYNHLL